MRFWDSSALVPLLVEEPDSPQVTDLLSEDPVMVAWWAARVECASALRRREREGRLTPADVRRSIQLLDELSESWNEVLPVHSVRALGERAVAVHALRAADALQLAAAQTWSGNDPSGAELVCLDAQLRDAAAREGFSTVP